MKRYQNLVFIILDLIVFMKKRDGKVSESHRTFLLTKIRRKQYSGKRTNERTDGRRRCPNFPSAASPPHTTRENDKKTSRKRHREKVKLY